MALAAASKRIFHISSRATPLTERRRNDFTIARVAWFAPGDSIWTVKEENVESKFAGASCAILPRGREIGGSSYQGVQVLLQLLSIRYNYP